MHVKYFKIAFGFVLIKLKYIKRLLTKLYNAEVEIKRLTAESVNYVYDRDKLQNHCRTEKRQILIVGWYGAYNYGDELMLRNVISEIDLDTTDVSVVLDRSSRYNLTDKYNVRGYYPPDNVCYIESIVDSFDEIIIGGAHIDDFKSIDCSFIPYLAIKLSLAGIGKDKIVRWVAVSSNKKLKNKEYIKSISNIALGAKEFSVRDVYSLLELQRCGVRNVCLRRDLAYLMNFNIKIITITLIEFVDRDIIFELLKGVLEFINQSGVKWKVFLIPFYNGNHNDTVFYSSIINGLSEVSRKNISIAPEFNNVDDMLLFLRG